MKILYFLQDQILNPIFLQWWVVPWFTIWLKFCFVTSRFSAWQTSGLLPQTKLETRMVRSFLREPDLVQRSADFGSDENSSKIYKNIFS